MDDRGLSTQVGALLATVVVLVMVAVPAVYAVGGIGDDADAPSLDIEGSVTTAAVTLTNAGGDGVALDSLSVVVVADGESTEKRPSTAETLRPGENWSTPIDANLSTGDLVNVYVTHVPTDTVVFEGQLLVEPDPALNNPPSVTATAADSIIEESERTQLTAAASDPDGDDLSYEWQLHEGESAASLGSTTGETVQLQAGSVEAEQAVVAEVIVSDGQDTASGNVSVTVVPATDDSPPAVLSLSASGHGEGTLAVNLTVNESLSSLDVTVRKEPGNHDAHVLGLSDFAETVTGSGVRYDAAVTGLEEGTYRATVQSAADEAGNELQSTPSDTGEVTVNDPPVVETFEVTDGSGRSPARVDLTVSDPEGWSDGAEVTVTSMEDGEVVDTTTREPDDNPHEFGPDLKVEAPHDQADGESYEVTVTVVDGDGGEASATETVPYDAPKGGGNDDDADDDSDAGDDDDDDGDDDKGGGSDDDEQPGNGNGGHAGPPR